MLRFLAFQSRIPPSSTSRSSNVHSIHNMKVLSLSLFSLANFHFQSVVSFTIPPIRHEQIQFYSSSSTRLFGIVDEVSQEMKTAMKAKDQIRLNTIRLIRAEFANAQIQHQVDQLSDEQAQAVLRKMSKMRADSIKMYSDNGATERAEAERAERNIIEAWLPKMADEEMTRKWIKEAIETVGSKDNMGKVMGALMKSHKMEAFSHSQTFTFNPLFHSLFHQFVMNRYSSTHHHLLDSLELSMKCRRK
ncbi:hypothetical protein MPSEU_001057500 [Mayamaea pseudoterrestris]|nr:hypothetical protein MPSEU_001057500 [Mayamaea pseudoterrestris]